MQDKSLNIAAIHQRLRSLMRETGEFIMQERIKFTGASIEFKGGKDMVTHVDKGAEAMLVKGCEAILPGSGFLLEEGGEVKTQQTHRWIIDPVDGTTNFVHGLPFYNISVGLQVWDHLGKEDWVTVLGAVYCPPLGEYFHASLGEGAFLNDRPIRVSSTEILKRSLIGTGFPYDLQLRREAMPILDEMMQHCQGSRRFGAAALDLAYVACGRLDGFFEITLNAWDVAAGALLVKEAGGKVTDWKGREDYLFGEELVASNRNIHEAMLDILKKPSK